MGLRPDAECSAGRWSDSRYPDSDQSRDPNHLGGRGMIRSLNPPAAGPKRRLLERPRAIELTSSPAPVLAANEQRIGAWIRNDGGMLEVPLALPVTAGATGALALAKVLDS